MPKPTRFQRKLERRLKAAKARLDDPKANDPADITNRARRAMGLPLIVRPVDPAHPVNFPELTYLGIDVTWLEESNALRLTDRLLRGWMGIVAGDANSRRAHQCLPAELRAMSPDERCALFIARWAEYRRTYPDSSGALACPLQEARPVQDDAKPLKQADVDFSAT
jgi:hypothetical protein